MGVAPHASTVKDQRQQRKRLVIWIMRGLVIGTLVAALGLYACSQRAIPEPEQIARPPILPKPPVIQPLPAVATQPDWQDWPLTPGDWAYRRDNRGSVALFGAPGADAQFLLRCDLGERKVVLSRQGAFIAGQSGRMTIRASSALKSYEVANTEGATTPYVAATLSPTDPQLDAMAFSRGRFIVSIKGGADLVVPAWPEVTRVVEDCRG